MVGSRSGAPLSLVTACYRYHQSSFVGNALIKRLMVANAKSPSSIKLHRSSGGQVPNRNNASVINKRIHSSSKTNDSISVPLMNPSQRGPTAQQLRTLFVASSVPMIGFGFMDNFIMIQSAGYIDATLGATLGIATLTAAAFGQIISDVSGVVFGGTIERVLQKLNLVKTPSLTHAQRALPRCRNIAMAGSVTGIVVGCLLGASSLLFVDLEAHERQQKATELRDIVKAMLSEEAVPCEECNLYLTGPTGDFVAQNQAGDGARIRPVKSADQNSLVTQCLHSKELVVRGGSFLCVPIIQDGEMLGVLEFRNKLLDSKFTEEEKRAAGMMARHMAIFMGRLSDS